MIAATKEVEVIKQVIEIVDWHAVHPASLKRIGLIDVDLSDLAGQSPRLILRVEENGGRSLHAIGYWQDARIERPE